VSEKKRELTRALRDLNRSFGGGRREAENAVHYGAVARFLYAVTYRCLPLQEYPA
jgi:hypothetical protein